LGEQNLEIEQDIETQRRSWKRQRVVWVVMALIALAALLGFCGSPGPFARVTAGSTAAPLWLEYNRFGRYQTKTTSITAHISPTSVVNGEIHLWINNDYLQNCELEETVPRPEHVESGSDRTLFIFKGAAGQSATASFYFEPQKVGLVNVAIGLEGGDSFYFRQYIYP
jgi:hypothetical protein